MRSKTMNMPMLKKVNRVITAPIKVRHNLHNVSSRVDSMVTLDLICHQHNILVTIRPMQALKSVGATRTVQSGNGMECISTCSRNHRE